MSLSGRLLGGVAALMAVSFGIWILIVLREPLVRAEPKVLSTVHAFDDVAVLPTETIEAAFNNAKQRMQRRNSQGNVWSIVARVTGWIAFAGATLVTAAAAYYGRDTVPANATTDEALANVRAKLGRYAWIAGLTAAVIAVGTATSERAANEAAACYKAADDIQSLIGSTRQQFDAANLTKGTAQDVLDHMVELAGRL